MTVYETIEHKNTSKRLVFTRRRVNCTFLTPWKTPFPAAPKPETITPYSYFCDIERAIMRLHPGITKLMRMGEGGLRCPQDNTPIVWASNALLSPRAPFQRRRL